MILRISLIALILLSVPMVSAEPTIPDAMDALLTGQDDDYVTARDFLVRRDAAAVKALHHRLFPNLKSLIENLGNETFHVRKQATDELIKIGVLCLPSIRKTMETTDDPEVQSRCRLIISKTEGRLKGAPDTRASYFNRALDVVLRCQSTPAESQDFMLDYFSRFRELPAELQGLLNVAAARCTDSEILKKHLLAEDDLDNSVIILEELGKRFPDEIETITRDYYDSLRKRKFNVANIINDMGEKELSTEATMAVFQRLNRIPGFDQHRDRLAKELLQSQNAKAFNLGIVFVMRDPGPYMEAIMARVLSGNVNGNIGNSIGYMTNCERHIYPYARELVKSRNFSLSDVAKRAMMTTPETYKAFATDLLQRLDKPSLSKAGAEILIQLGMEDFVGMTLASQLRKDTPFDQASPSVQRLRDMDYKGFNYDQWWSRGMENCPPNRYSSRSRFIRSMKISINAVLPYIESLHLDARTLEYLKKTAGGNDHLPALLNAGMRTLKKYPSSDDMVYFLAINQPDKAEELVTGFLDNSSKKPRYYRGICRLILRMPSLESVLKNYASNGSLASRYNATITLVKARKALDFCKQTLLSFDPKGQSRSFCDSVADTMLEAGVPAEQVEQWTGRPLMARLSFSKDYMGYDYTLERSRLTSIPDLEEELVQVFNGRNYEVAYKLGCRLLELSPKNRVGVKYLNELALTVRPAGDAKVCWDALGVVGDAGPTLSLERMRWLHSQTWYHQDVVRAIRESKPNRKNGMTLILENLETILCHHYARVDDLLRETSPEVSQAVINKLVGLVETDIFISHRALRALKGAAGYLNQDQVTRLLNAYQKSESLPYRRGFLLLLAELGPQAEALAQVLNEDFDASKGKTRFRYLIAMGNIAPDREMRRKFIKELVLMDPDYGTRSYERVYAAPRDLPDLKPTVLKQFLHSGVDVVQNYIEAMLTQKTIHPSELESLKELFDPTLETQALGMLLRVLVKHPAKAGYFKKELENARADIQATRGYKELLQLINVSPIP